MNSDLDIGLFLIFGGIVTHGTANKPMDCLRCEALGLPGPTIIPGDECRIITGVILHSGGKTYDRIPICADCYARFLDESRRTMYDRRDDEEGEEWKK